MVEDELTDGRRIAELLASELTGLSEGLLSDVSVVDADPDVTPAPGGAFAFAIEADGERVGTVEITPDAAVLDVTVPVPDEAVRERDGLQWADTAHDRVEIRRGAAVKAAVDVLRSVLDG